MSDTVDTSLGDLARPPVPVSSDVRALDDRSVLTEIVRERAVAERAEARVLALAVHFVDLHPVTEDHPAATAAPHGGQVALVAHGPADPAGAPGLAGPGTPAVAAWAVEELGAALGVPYLTALTLVTDSVELCYRLPRLWSLVQAGRLPAWRARVVAARTTTLSGEGVAFVDAQAAILVQRRRLPSRATVDDLVHEARLRHDPDLDRGLEEAAMGDRGVWFDHQTSTASAATTNLTATLDAFDALDLDAALGELAGTLGRLGDDSSHQVRRATALSLLAHPQRVLDLATPTESPSTEPTRSDCTSTHRALGGPGLLPTTPRMTLHVHANLADLARLGSAAGTAGDAGAAGTASLAGTLSTGRTSSGGTDGTAVAGATGGTGMPESHDGYALVERFGPVSLAVLRSWAVRCAGLTVQPVLDPSAPHGVAGSAVDRHDPPSAMRELVVTRDGQCVFPGCRVPGRRCDLDHIEPYEDPDAGGPPGQTHPGNLACLCRRHHRLKTFTAWTYRRLDGPDGIGYRWTSPRGHRFVTDANPVRGPLRR